MSNSTLKLPSERAADIEAALINCQLVRNGIIADMTETLKDPAADTTPLAKAYVGNRLKGYILAELEGAGSTRQAYELSKNNVMDAVARLKDWAGGMFPSQAVQKLQPEDIFEQVWDDITSELKIA